MDTAKRAADALRMAERRLQELVGEAAANGDYDLATQITEWARGLSSLSGSASPGSGKRNGDKMDLGRAVSGDELGPAEGPVSRMVGNPVMARKGRRLREYPKFVRQGDVLIKIGWSESQTSTYEHRAPKEALDAVVRRAIAAVKRSEVPFTAESLTDLQAHQDRAEVPGYQLYLCLAWLKRCRLIRQHGRRGYSLVNPGSFTSGVEQAWNGLPRQTL